MDIRELPPGETVLAYPALAELRAGKPCIATAKTFVTTGDTRQRHLSTLPGAQVHIRLEIEVGTPGGAPEQVVRTVSENGRTLKFTLQGFEEGESRNAC